MMTKRLMVLIAVLAMALVAAVPALAQQFPPGTITVTGVLGEGGRSADGSGVFSITDEATGEGFVIERGSPLAQYVGERVELDAIPREPNAAGPRILDIVAFTPVRGDDPPSGEAATATFELTVEGEPPEGTEFFYAIGQGQLFPLTDPDGDGAYTGSREFVSRVLPIQTLPVQVLQSNADGTREVIRDFGLVTFDADGEDKTFEASVSFEDGQEPGPGDEVTTTGVLRESGDGCNECAKHAIMDETSGKTYYLISDPESPFGDYVDLDSYVGQRVTVSGILQMQGQDNLYVTSIEPVDGTGEEVTVTFELIIEGEVSEGQALYLDSIPGGDGPDLIFCTTPTNPEAVSPSIPRCEDGATYSETQEVPADVPFSYEYFAATPNGPEVFSTGTDIFDEDDTVSATYDANDPTRCDRDFILGCGPDDEVTATYQLTVTGEPPADAAFFATGVANPSLPDDAPLRELTDPDSDGVYTAEQTTIPGDYHVRIVQGTGTRPCGPFGEACPGEPSSNIEDFGTIALEDDETFSASISFNNKGGVTTPDPGNGDPDNGGSGSGGSGGGNPGSGGIRGFLPSTGGGMTLMVLGVGALLVGGGLLVRRVAR